ncbi:MAG: hypothetical protein AAF242_21170, partial [Bacteroidota bacterium]
QQAIYYLKYKDWPEFVTPLLKKIRYLAEKSTLRDGLYFLTKKFISETEDYLEIIQEKRKYNPYLQEQNDQLDQYYHQEKLRLGIDMFSRNIVVNAKYKPTFFDRILEQIQNNDDLSNNPNLQVYKATFTMINSPENTGHYFQMKSLLEEHIQRFPEREQLALHSYMLNYCVRKINSGATEFYAEVLELYKLLLNEGLLLVDGFLTQWTYINIVTAGLRLKNFAWTEQFIYQYKSALMKEYQENVFNYSLVSLYFEKGDWGSALELLQQVDFTDGFYQMAARITQLKIYYLSEEWEAFGSLILATQRFLSRNKQLSTYQKKSNLNFLRIINRLFKFKMKAKYLGRKRFQEQQEKILIRINETHPLGNKSWLKEQYYLL